jgi:hypothetical protein
MATSYLSCGPVQCNHSSACCSTKIYLVQCLYYYALTTVVEMESSVFSHFFFSCLPLLPWTVQICFYVQILLSCSLLYLCALYTTLYVLVCLLIERFLVFFSLCFDSYNLSVLASFTACSFTSQWLLDSQCSNLVALYLSGCFLFLYLCVDSYCPFYSCW